MSEPLISCLCVTRGRVRLLQRAIQCFRNQTHHSRELIAVYEADDTSTKDYLNSLDEDNIKVFEVSVNPKKTLGELRNHSIDLSNGEYICQWDDDDWYHEDRLAAQLEALLQSDKPACVLSRWTCLDAQTRQAFIGFTKAWEGSILCEKSQIKPYPNLKRGEDTAVINRLHEENKLHYLERPELYVYTFHGANTWNREHWTRVLIAATPLSDADTQLLLEQTDSQSIADDQIDLSLILEVTRDVCEQAMTKSPSGVTVTRYRFAGLPVRMRAAGPDLAMHMNNTFAHLRVDEDDEVEPVLKIDTWDKLHTTIGCPGVPFVPESTECLDAGLVTKYCSGQVIRYERGHYVNCLDRQADHILSSRSDGKTLALYERSKPFPIMLATWYRDQGVQQLHGGLVSRDGHGVLFVGQSGSGKSTCTLACALDSFDYLGDDHVGLQMNDDVCQGHSFYNAARVDDDHLKRFEELREHEIKPACEWDMKSMVLMSEAIPDRMAVTTRITAVVMPTIVGTGPTRFKKASKVETFLRLAPSTLQVPLSAGPRGFMNLLDFIPRMPCYRMDLGENVRDIPGCVHKILDEVLAQ